MNLMILNLMISFADSDGNKLHFSIASIGFSMPLLHHWMAKEQVKDVIKRCTKSALPLVLSFRVHGFRRGASNLLR